jgi:hypothetical protein
VLITIGALIGTYIVYVHVIERRAATEFGARYAVPELATGFVIGGLLFSLVMLILWQRGVVSVGDGAGPGVLGIALCGAFEGAALVELLFRGVLFRIVEESLGAWIALAISAIVFGALHGFNPGASLLSSVAIALEAGVLLAAVYAYTRRLWMAIGLHAAWDFTEGGVFGANNSGHASPSGLASHFHGPELLTGGLFGPEASIIAVLVCLAAAVVFIVLTIRKGLIVAPFWRRCRAIDHVAAATG